MWSSIHKAMLDLLLTLLLLLYPALSAVRIDVCSLLSIVLLSPSPTISLLAPPHSLEVFSISSMCTVVAEGLCF